MTDAEYAATKERVFTLAKKWQTALGLNWWAIKYEWCRDPLSRSAKQHDNNDYVVARTTAHWEYGTATIEINLPECTDLDDTAIQRMLVHEYMHILVNETRETEDWLNHEERVCTTLTQAIFWLLASELVEPPDLAGALAAARRYLAMAMNLAPESERSSMMHALEVTAEAHVRYQQQHDTSGAAPQ